MMSYRIFKDSMKASWPICIGYLPLGIAFGVVAQKAGIHPPAIACMSVFVYAGSAQFIAVSMWSGGVDPISVVLATFVINMRHILMSSALSVYLRGCGRGFLSLFAYGVTDESFAVNLTRFNGGPWDPERALALNHISNAVWVGSTILGGYAGEAIPAGSFGIDYALTAMFISLLVLQLRGGLYVLTACAAGLCALALSLVLPGNIHVVIAALLAATFGFMVRRRREERRVKADA